MFLHICSKVFAAAVIGLLTGSARSQSAEPELVRTWMNGLSSSSAEVRLRTLKLSRRPRDHRERILSALTPFLTSESSDERAWSMYALGGFTPSSLPYLFEALDHPDFALRNIAAEGIERSIRPCECETSRSSGSYEMLRTVEIERLGSALSNDSEHVRVLVAMTLWKLDRDADPVREKLELAAQEDTSPIVRFWARQANKRRRADVDTETRMRIDDLVRILDLDGLPEGPAAREFAIFGAAAVPALSKNFFCAVRLRGPHAHSRITGALAQFGEDGVAVLAIGLEHEEYARQWSAHFLVRSGSAALPAMPAILSAWRHDHDVVWDERSPADWSMLDDIGWLAPPVSAWDVGRLGPDTLRFLIDAVDDPHALVRVRAARALEGMKDLASPALEALALRFDDSDSTVRGAAAKAVLAIAPPESPLKKRALEIVEQLRPK